jgi:predicted component of type VI protein secretion system
VFADYEFSDSVDDADLLDHFARVAQCAFTPVLTSASPRAFGVDAWANCTGSVRLDQLTENPPWRSLRESAHSRFLALTTSRVLTRLPYRRQRPQLLAGFKFDEVEALRGNAVDAGCWTNAGYLWAEMLAESIGVRTGVERNVFHRLGRSPQGVWIGSQTGRVTASDSPITSDADAAGWIEAGFMPLLQSTKDPAVIRFPKSVTFHRPPLRSENTGSDGLVGVDSLPSLLTACRIMQDTLEVASRIVLGEPIPAVRLEEQLNRNLGNYIAAGGPAMPSRFPLKAGRVVVRTDQNSPGQIDLRLLLTLADGEEDPEVELTVTLTLLEQRRYCWREMHDNLRCESPEREGP